MNDTKETGLYLVATPIGNLADIGKRALKILAEASVIYAEDTRHSQYLLSSYGITTHCQSLHEHNEIKRIPEILARVEKGELVAVISDAGMPCIADPGFPVVRAVRKAGFPVRAVPGPCAFVTALALSGLPTDHFLFANFPPKKSAARLVQLQQYKTMYTANEKWAPTICYYVGPGQLTKFLAEIGEIFGLDMRVVLVRELTKIYEEVLDKTVSEYAEYYRERNPKGEFVLLFHPLNKGAI